MTTAPEEAAAADGEELDPLFDYKRVQPTATFRFDDSDLEKATIFRHCNKRPKADETASACEEGEKAGGCAETAKVVVLDEEDWLLPPPPPNPAVRAPAQEDSALRELRLIKEQELPKITESAQDILKRLDEAAKKEDKAKKLPEPIILDEASEPQVEKTREKIVISIQDKDGQQQFRVYKDDKFEKVIKAYGKKVKLNPSDLTFVFDGDKINPATTPKDLDLEDDDMIEVCHKHR